LQTLVAIGAAITTSRLGNVVIGFEELDAGLSLDISYELVGLGQDTARGLHRTRRGARRARLGSTSSEADVEIGRPGPPRVAR
jgi:hypothetical protein